LTDELNYPSYLALDELLKLQRPLSKPEHPDELLFIIVHQASELWFKLIIHELEALSAWLADNDTLGALSTVKRLNALVRIVTAQLSALETLPPQSFAQFRGYLGTSSGSQSVQFRAIEAMSGLRDPHFVQVLEEHGAAASGSVQSRSRSKRSDARTDLHRREPARASDARGGSPRV
jgi:tryptophan 2,3-dioxygenase